MRPPAFDGHGTVGAARRAMTALFADAGLPTPDLDAGILAGHALRLDRSALLIAAERPLGAALVARTDDQPGVGHHAPFAALAADRDDAAELSAHSDCA